METVEIGETEETEETGEIVETEETIIEEVMEVIQIRVQKMIHIIDIGPEVEIILEVGLEVEGDLAKLVLIATSQIMICPREKWFDSSLKTVKSLSTLNFQWIFLMVQRKRILMSFIFMER